MKTTKLLLLTLFTLASIACSSAVSTTVKPAIANEAIIEKNKQTAVLNEVGATVREAQSIEKLGRNMESYRLALDAETKRACNTVSEDNQRELANLENRINSLPGNYKDQLISIVPDLNQCVTCAKNAMESCVKARASINTMIKEIYP